MTSVLIIDDDENFRKIVELKLKSFLPDFQCTIFDNITDARDFLENNPTLELDLVVLDEHLPDGKGTELLQEGWLNDLAVLMISSDTKPEMAGKSLKAGAMFFINKLQMREELFRPLVEGIIERSKLQKEISKNREHNVKMQTIKTLVSTLRHEINNPLGAVLGAAFVIQCNKNSTDEQIDAAKLVEQSGQRIKQVLDRLCETIDVETVEKGHQLVYQIPGDEPWKKSE